MLIGDKGPAVVLDARTCAWLERYAGLTTLRGSVRGTDPAISRQLEEVRAAAMSWVSSASAELPSPNPRNLSQSQEWLDTETAAGLAGVTSRAIRKAIAEGRLPAKQVGGRYRIQRVDLEHFRAVRSGREAS